MALLLPANFSKKIFCFVALLPVHFITGVAFLRNFSKSIILVLHADQNYKKEHRCRHLKDLPKSRMTAYWFSLPFFLTIFNILLTILAKSKDSDGIYRDVTAQNSWFLNMLEEMKVSE
jgi:hypothetical protein